MRKHTLAQTRLQDATHAAVGAVEAARVHTGHAAESARLAAAEHIRDTASQVRGSAQEVTAGARRTAGSLTARANASPTRRRFPVALGAAAVVGLALAVWRLARDTGRERPNPDVAPL
ncbi:hypothetical protein [Streptacidiphilus jiangxiensis]|uniref:hypothetical protein n=1 Tax=Streptacidiphilus jiangxiensis TaxID=235985 RepID=UPI001160606B|nr:hypothetical protein [Streptacidiphilus jiangxiensis]